ncbi:MAG: deoxyribonuclease IV [Nitrospira sp.]|nr:deoxyribonuclease IV [bacterium]MBL7048266.1 deoxyribonuclease IV [Nitrospira sp.]
MDTTKKREYETRTGVHVSIAGGVSRAIEQAVSLGCTTLQMFSHSPRQWQCSPIMPEEVARFKNLREKYKLSPVFIHASYLINLASKTAEGLEKSIKLLAFELQNASLLGVDYVIVHTGSASAEDPVAARKRAVSSLNEAVRSAGSARILLENTAGRRGDIASSVKDLAEILNACESSAVSGICLDTCHAFAAGYDFRLRDEVDRMFNEMEKYIGMDKLKLIHCNDSKLAAGTGIDRHEHLGKGHIGLEGLQNFFADQRIAGIPLILETPKETAEDDLANLKTLRQLISPA